MPTDAELHARWLEFDTLETLRDLPQSARRRQELEDHLVRILDQGWALQQEADNRDHIRP